MALWIKPTEPNGHICYIYVPGGRTPENDALVDKLLNQPGSGVTCQSAAHTTY